MPYNILCDKMEFAHKNTSWSVGLMEWWSIGVVEYWVSIPSTPILQYSITPFFLSTLAANFF
jgi:hypothetical protein